MGQAGMGKREDWDREKFEGNGIKGLNSVGMSFTE